MSLTKDGFYKSFSGAIGNDNYLLEAGGGHIGWGNAANQIPYSNGTVNTSLNADMTDGLHVHGGRNNEANKIVRTDGNGYIQTGYINTNVGTEDSLSWSRVFFEYNNDGYIRKASISRAKTVFFGGQVGSPSVPIYWTGSAFATCIVSFGNANNGEHNANNINDNGIKYYTSNGPSTSLGATTDDGALYSQAYSTSWVAQIAQDYRNGGLYVRGKNAGTWQPWYRVWDNRTTYVSSEIGYIGGVAITNVDKVDGMHANEFVPKRHTTRFYPFVNSSAGQPWYKITLPWAGYTSGSNAWMMTTMEVVLGGSYDNGNNGRIYLQYYFTKNSSNVWSVGAVRGTTIGYRIIENEVTIKYDIANPGIFYIKANRNIYNSIGLENITASDTAPNFDFRNTTIEAIAESSVPSAANQTVPLYHTITTQNGYWANLNIQTTPLTNTIPQLGGLYVINDSSNNGYDGLGYFRAYTNNDWGLIVDKSQSYTYGIDIRAGGAYALRVGNGNTRLIGATIIGVDATPTETLDVRGIIRSTGSGVYLRIGPQNSSHAHYETTAGISHWFNKRIDVNGAIWRYGTNYGIADDGRFYALAMYANRSASSTDGGVSLYGTDFTYSILFRGTGWGGKLGRVQADWATYLTMDGTVQRGWIFRNSSLGNVASISNAGEAYFYSIGRDNYIAYPNGAFSIGNSDKTGAIQIALPTTAFKSSTMIKFTVEIYNYSTHTSATYIVSGYNYSDNNWYNVTAYSIGYSSNNTLNNLTVRFGRDSTREYIWIGETNTTWSYPNIIIKDVLLGHSGNDYNRWATGWAISFVTSFQTIQHTITKTSTNNTILDRTNNTITYSNYGASGLGLGSITWLTCWNGYELRAISKGELGGLTNVYQHTANNVDYPLVWSNQNNTSTVQANQLHKSYADLVYNPANKEIKTWSFAPQGENTNRGIHFPGGAWINSIGTSIIFRNATIRFGGSGWDWNAWAGLNFDGNTTINIGMPNNSHWTANSNKTAGTIRTVSSKIEIFPDGNSNYGEGLRIHTASNGWTTLMLAGSDNTGFNGTTANSWSLHTYSSNFYINKNNSNGAVATRLWGHGNGYTFGSTSRSSANVTVTNWIEVTGATSATMSYSTTNPRITFSENGSQAVGIVYTDYDSYRASKGLKVMDVDNTDTGNVWLEVQGSIYGNTVYSNLTGSSTSGGLSLYANDANTYAVMFRGTGNRGKWGDVQSDWATYFTMSNTLQRGWVWQSGTAEANMSAALSVRGVFATRAVGNNAGYIAFPQNNSYYTSTSTVTGALKVVLPRYQTNTMIMFDVNIFTYDEGTSNIVTYRIGGYEYGSTGWYAPVSKVFSWGRGDKVNLNIRFGYDGSKTCITIGETNTTWSYPQVSISNITYGYSDIAISSWGYGWGISFTTTLPSSVSTTFTDPYFNGMYWANQRVRPTSSTTTTPQFGKVMINTTSSSYQLNVAGDSYATGWSRAGSGFYIEGQGVHYTHLGSYGEIYLSANNVLNFTTGSWSTLYFNYGGSGKLGNTWVSNYVWHAGSTSTYADHNIGKLHVRPTSGNYSWNEGIRLHPASNGWATFVLCGTDNTGDSGTSANSWSLHAYGGNFYLSKNGSTGGTSYMDNISNKWYFNTTSGGEAVNVGGWINTVGACGWYNSTYGGGMWMNDSTYVRVYNGKYLYTTYQYYDVGNADYNIDHVYASNDRYIRPMAFSTFGNRLRDSGYLDGRYLRYSGWWTSGSGQSVDNASGMIFAYSNHGVPGSWGIVATFDYQLDSSYRLQLYGDGYNSNFYFRVRSSDRGGWYGGWKRLLDSVNWATNTNSASGLLRSDGGISWFYWSGQSGQPTWLWGGNSQHTYYLYNPSNFDVNSAAKLRITGYQSDGLSFYQTSSAFDESDAYFNSWAHYIIANHGNGSSYYHYSIALPFWSWPRYKRQTGSVSSHTQWYSFITEENIGNYYWANLSVQKSSNAYTVPSFAAIKIRNSSPSYHSADNIISGTAGEIYFAGNFHIDSRGSNKLYLNHYTSNSIAMVTGGGNVGIGTDSPSYGLTLATNKRLYIYGEESNPIYTEYHPNSHISTNSPESNAAIRHGFVFKWYDTYWKIGNVRGGSTNSAGFGIAYYGGSQLQLLVRPGSKTWIYYGIHTFTCSQSWTNNPEYGNDNINGISIKSTNGGMSPYIHFIPYNTSRPWRFATYYEGSGYGYENNLILYQGYTSGSNVTLSEYIFRGYGYGSQGKGYVATCEGNEYNLVILGVFVLYRSSAAENTPFYCAWSKGLITPVIVSGNRQDGWKGQQYDVDGGMIIRMDMRSGYQNYTNKTTINVVSAVGVICETFISSKKASGVVRWDAHVYHGALGSFDIAVYSTQPSQYTNSSNYYQTSSSVSYGRYLSITARNIAGWSSNGGIGKIGWRGLMENEEGTVASFRVTCFGYLS